MLQRRHPSILQQRHPSIIALTSEAVDPDLTWPAGHWDAEPGAALGAGAAEPTLADVASWAQAEHCDALFTAAWDGVGATEAGSLSTPFPARPR